MGRSALRLIGIADAWGPTVREGRLYRDDGTSTPVWVRPTDLPADASTLAQAREDLRLLARAAHPVLLHPNLAVAVAGRVALVYPALDAVSLARVLAGLRAARDVVPVRVALEVTAAAAEGVDALLRLGDGSRTGFHPGPGPEDLLLRATGALVMAGGGLFADGTPPPWRPAARPPRPSARPAEQTWALGVLLAELLLGDVPTLDTSDHAAFDASLRRVLIRVLSRPGDNPGEGTRRALEAALAWEPVDRPPPGRFAARLRELPAAGSGPTLAEWTPTALARARGDTVPVEELALARGVGTGMRPPAPAVRAPDDRAGRPPPPRGPAAPPEPWASPPTMVPDADALPPQPPADEPPPPPPIDEPAWGLPGRVAPPPSSRPVGVPPVGASPPADGPRIDLQAHAFGDVPLAIDGPDLPPLEARPRARSPVGILAALALTALVVGVVALVWRVQSRGDTPATEVLGPAPAVVDASPPEPAPPPEAPKAVEPAPPPEAPKAVEPAPAPTEKAARKPASKAPARPREPAPATPADPDEPTRIVPATTPAPAPSPAAEPAPAPSPAAEPAPAPADPGPYDVTFQSGDPAVTFLEVRCGTRSGTGATVTLTEVPAGSCKVTGTGPESPRITLVTVAADRTWTCFADGGRSCR